MYAIDHMPSVIELGHIGENAFRPIEIDMTAWLDTMPDGVSSILCIRPGETDDDAYIAVTVMNGNVLKWTPLASDLGLVEGYGEIQIRMGTDGMIGRSVRVKTMVRGSIGSPSTLPAPQQPWIDQMAALKEQTINAAEDAQDWVEEAKKWVDGKDLNGIDVPATDPQHDYNAKYFAEQAQTATVHQPIIGQNKNWWIWNQQSGAYVDSGKPAAWPDSDPELTNALTDVVDDWLTDHPEATTTVQDGAITEQKINSDFLPNIFNGAYTIKSFTGDLGTAVNNAFVNNNTVIVPANSTYYSYSVKIIVPSGKTLVILGEIHYDGTDAAIETIDSLYSKIYVHTIFAPSGSCIRIKSANGLCEFNEIHSRYLYGKIGIEIINTGTRGIQHCNFYSNYIRATQYGISIIAEQQNAWCGEIKFFGGEINGSNAIGVYTRGELTALRMFGVGFESLSNILDTENSSEINLFGCRNEDAGKYIFRGTVKCVTIEGDFYASSAIDIENLEGTNGIVFRGAIRNTANGNAIGTELYISPTLKVFAKGPTPANVAYKYYNSDGTTIGGDNIFPRIARLAGPANGTYKLSDAYSIGNLEEIIIYAERSGIKLTNADGTKVLFTTTDAQSVWRVTAADVNSYFSPSGYIVEKITPVK